MIGFPFERVTAPPTKYHTVLKNIIIFKFNIMLLSIDVGIKNLAMCQINEDTKEIVQWDVSGVPPEHEDGLYPCLRRHLDAKPWVLDSTVVLIEKQPGQNKKMKTVENFLQAYFVIKTPSAETIVYDARHKVPDVTGGGKARYRQRKATAVIRCREFLEGSEVNEHWMDTFRASKKKDDLADTVLQALSFINRVEPKKKTTTETKKKKITPRKPTANQKETKYSISNLAWMVKNHSEADLKKDKRFQKDLNRYFTSLEELSSKLLG